jgi:hypothetical protein
MTRRGPILTLLSVAILAAIFLWANTLVHKQGSTAYSTTAAPAATGLQALYAGRSSGDQVTVTIAVNGRRAAAYLDAGRPSQVFLQGSATGSQVTLSGGSGVGLTGSSSGPNMFGTITGFSGQSFPFSAAPAVVEAVYAGRSSGNEVGLAIVTDGDRAAAYVCNGQTIEAWLQGSVKGNQVTLTGRNGAGLVGSLSGLAMFGMVTPRAGQTFPFSAELSPRPSGVYQARITVNGLATRIGWAVLPDETQLGIAVVGAAKQSAPPLNLGDGSFVLDGARYEAAPVDGDETVVSP